MSLDSPLVADFKMKRQEHTIRHAEVLPLPVIRRLRTEADCMTAKGVFASMIRLIAGG